MLVASAGEPGDLLVIGTGRRSVMRRLIGSPVGRYCLGHAGCPVVAVPPAEHELSIAGWSACGSFAYLGWAMLAKAELEHAAGHGLRGWAFRHRALSVSHPG